MVRALFSRHLTIAFLLGAASITSSGLGQCTSGKLVASDAASFDTFGTSVAVSGSFALIGSPSADSPGAADAGAAYIFAKNGLSWSQSQKLIASDRSTGDSFGSSVAIDGDYAVIGAPNDTYFGFNNLGSVYVFHRVSGIWVQEFNILAPSGFQASNNRFGSALSISGSTIVIGAQYEGFSKGAAYVYTRSGSSWSLQQRLQPAGMAGSALFAESVSIVGDTLAVGASGDNSTRGFATGAVYTFQRAGNLWSQNAKLIGANTTSSSQFGRDVSMDANQLLIASPFEGAGRSYIFDRVGTLWSANTSFAMGTSVAVKGATLFIGGVAGGQEVVQVYRRNIVNQQGVWSSSITLMDNDGTAVDQFGQSIAWDGTSLIAGAQANDFGNLANPGAAYSFSPDINTGDTCAQALPLSLGTVFGCTSGLAANGATTCGSSNTSPDGYYTFTTACAGSYSFTSAGSTFDTVLSVHSACPATAANTLACNDDTGAAHYSTLNVTLGANQTVVVRIAGFNGLSGAYELTAIGNPPTNTNCTSADSVSEGTFPLDNCFVASDSVTVAGTVMSGELWYSYSPSCNGSALFSTCGSNTEFDTVLQVFGTSSCRLLTGSVLGVSDDSVCGIFGRQSNLTLPVQTGHTYLVRVGGYPTPGGSFVSRGHGQLTIDLSTACPADFNQDGGVDGADVNAFYQAWENGDSLADVNCDGGVDGSDITVFFAAWENGGC